VASSAWRGESWRNGKAEIYGSSIGNGGGNGVMAMALKASFWLAVICCYSS